MFRERVAVAFITLSLVFSAIFAYVVVQDLNNKTGQYVAAGTGNGTLTTTNAPSPGAAAPDAGASPAAGSSTTTTTSGGSGHSTSGGAAVANTQAKSGVTGDTITVGGIFDMTGPVDSSVERDTVRAYFAKINAAGGVNGRKLVMKYCDSQYDVNQTHICATQMVSANVLALVGTTAPKGEDGETKFLVNEGIPLIGGLGTPEEFHYHLSYPVSTPFTRYGVGIADLLTRNGFKHPAFIYISDVPWVAPVEQATIAALHAKGIFETHIEAAASTDGDYSQHVAALENQCDDQASGSGCPATRPDSLITALDPFSYGRLFLAMDRAQWHPPVVGGGLDKGNQQSAYGDQLNLAQSLVPFISPYDNASNPTVQDYLSTVQHYYPNQVPALDIYTQHAWTAAMVFVEAVKRAGSNLTRQSLVSALDGIQNFQTGWSTPITYGTGLHDPNHCFRFMKHDSKTADSGGTWHTVTPDWVCYQ